MLKKLSTFLLLLSLSFMTASQIIAAPGDNPTPGETTGITNPAIGILGSNPEAASSGLTTVAYAVIVWRALISVGGITVLIYMLWGAFEWIVSGSDAGKTQKARDKMTNAVIGLIILVGSFAIIGFIGTLLGFDLLKLTFPNTVELSPSIPS